MNETAVKRLPVHHKKGTTNMRHNETHTVPSRSANQQFLHLCLVVLAVSVTVVPAGVEEPRHQTYGSQHGKGARWQSSMVHASEGKAVFSLSSHHMKVSEKWPCGIMGFLCDELSCFHMIFPTDRSTTGCQVSSMKNSGISHKQTNPFFDRCAACKFADNPNSWSLEVMLDSQSASRFVLRLDSPTTSVFRKPNWKHC